jgi:hypothetical protein
MILNVVRAHMELMLKIKAQLMIHRQEEFSDKGPNRDSGSKQKPIEQEILKLTT